MTYCRRRDGFALVPDALAPQEVFALIAALNRVENSPSARRRETVYAIRNLLDEVPEVAALANSSALRSLITPVLGPNCFPVRGILFDKTPDANWNVVWHQDLSIAIRFKHCHSI